MAENSKTIGSIQRRDDLRNSVEKESSLLQAKRVSGLLENEVTRSPDNKIVLLFASNQKQSKALLNWSLGNSLPSISGSNQAAFFSHFAELANTSKLSNQGKLRILPLSTSQSGGANSFGNHVDKASLDKEFKEIEQALNDGYTIYGFQDNDKQSRYAIGGGRSANFYQSEDPRLTIYGVSQGCYVQAKLALLEEKYPPQKGYETLDFQSLFDTDIEQNFLETLKAINKLPDNIKLRLDRVEKAYHEYVEYNFKSFNPFHGQKGINRAKEFYQNFITQCTQDDVSEKELDKLVGSFLDDGLGNTYEHSFNVFLTKNYIGDKWQVSNKNIRDCYTFYKSQAAELANHEESSKATNGL